MSIIKLFKGRESGERERLKKTRETLVRDQQRLSEMKTRLATLRSSSRKPLEALKKVVCSFAEN